MERDQKEQKMEGRDRRKDQKVFLKSGSSILKLLKFGSRKVAKVNSRTDLCITNQSIHSGLTETTYGFWGIKRLGNRCNKTYLITIDVTILGWFNFND